MDYSVFTYMTEYLCTELVKVSFVFPSHKGIGCTIVVPRSRAVGSTARIVCTYIARCSS